MVDEKYIKGISIVIPILNEEDTVELLITRIQHSLNNIDYPYEIIFIDDHSTDDSAQIINAFTSTNKNIFFYSKQGKVGKSFSLIEGFNYAKYDIICMIDGDLQYPPEAILPMMNIIRNNETDIVIADRSMESITGMRRVFHDGFKFFFVKLLHRIDYDVQSGLKVFRHATVAEITFEPTPWTFDMEYLLKARESGFNITNFGIIFSKRFAGSSKINPIKASIEIGFSSIRLRFAYLWRIPQLSRVSDNGFYYKRRQYLTYTNLPLRESALQETSSGQKILIGLIVLMIFLLFMNNWHGTLLVIISMLMAFYFIDLLFNIFLTYTSLFKSSEINISKRQIYNNGENWPVYTILCPLYKEAVILPQLVEAIRGIDYPKKKLDVLLITEEDDTEIFEVLKSMNLPKYFRTIVVPTALPTTKPKACNYALQFAKGKYVVIYDAEDIPESDQLKKVVVAFNHSPNKLACIQAKLNYYNPAQNLLTRLFTLEYSLWFDLELIGLQSIRAPLPLGGTSNHFRIEKLRKLNAWDPFNVTEDADLGVRIARNNMRTAVINSTTFEEANSHLHNWLRQRSRWIKGYIQTYIVQMRNFKMYYETHQLRNLFYLQFIFGTKIISMLINPFMWLLTLVYFIGRNYYGNIIESLFISPFFYMGIIVLLVGNFISIYNFMIGVAKRENWNLVIYSTFIPMYWLMISVAAYYALYDLITKPFYWHKTTHGLHLNTQLLARNELSMNK